jgi:hypothetical protein
MAARTAHAGVQEAAADSAADRSEGDSALPLVVILRFIPVAATVTGFRMTNWSSALPLLASLPTRSSWMRR